jgi:hypothetical protein
MKLQKLGGYAAIAGVFAYISCVVLVGRIQPYGGWNDPAKMMAAISAAPAEFYLFTLLWLITYILLLPIFFAFRERMQADAPHLTHAMLIAMSVATAMAIAESIINLKSVGMVISQKDLSAFRACWAVTQGLHWANGHVLGWSCLLFGCAIIKTRAFSRILGGLFLLTGILWIPNVFLVHLGFTRLTLIYISTSCICAVWLGIALLREKKPQPAPEEMAAG